jgi:glucans biosynthesis protein C
MTIKREKDLSVETLRGAAIILVVAGHVIGDKADGGMRVADDSFLRHLYFTFEFLRMPLFTVISGWVYSLHPASKKQLQSFTLKKVRRLLLPMIFVGGAYFLLQYIVPGTNNKGNLADLWKLVIFPYTLYWYLPSLFLVFIVVALLDSFKMMSTLKNWLIVFFLALAVKLGKTYFLPDTLPNYFSYMGAMYLLPFFVLGVGIQRYKDFFSNRYLLLILGGCLAIGLIIQQLTWYNIVEYNMSKGTGIGLIIGLTGTIVLLKVKWKVRWLVWVGSFAYSIYLFHAFGTAGARILIKKAGLASDAIVFLVSLMAGLLLPVILEMVLDRFGLTRMIFLGRNYSKNGKGD